jgi:type I restriction enzyme M protein
VDQATHNKIVSFIWGIADDVLRDLFKRGKYPDVILPMCVLRRMDAVLEPTKQAVLDTKQMLDDARITEQRAALADAAGQAFYNTSRFTLRDLKSRGNRQQLLADFEDYLNGFSPNVQDILDNFKFRDQLPTLSKADALGALINKFLDPDLDLSPAGIDNHSMGTVFEELVRKFNEDNNEEAGEHWTPRDAVRLMVNLVFLPVEDQITSGIRREVVPYTPDAWVNNDATKIGYEVSFTRHFYKPQPLRTLAEISADILAIEKEAEGLLDGLLVAKAEA